LSLAASMTAEEDDPSRMEPFRAQSPQS
jgi:hypothetical protein